MTDKIVDSLPERRKVAEAIKAMAATHTEAELTVAARTLAAEHAPELVLAALIAHLDTLSSQLRGGLARLVTLLPRELTIDALQRAAADRSLGVQARATALMLLERWLGETQPPGLVAEVRQSEGSAMASLREAVTEGRIRSIVLLEYVEQMQQHPADTAFAVMAALDTLPEEDRVEMLRLIAQDRRTNVARSALQRIEQIAVAGDPNALRALHALRFTLPPELAALAERALRKLQMRGRTWQLPDPSGWRALLSDVEMSGALWLWFVGPPSPEETLFVGVFLLHPRAGLIHGTALNVVPVDLAPAAREVGSVFTLAQPGAGVGRYVEAPFDAGRQLLLRTLATTWSAQDERPLPREYLLQNEFLWQFAAPVEDSRIDEILDGPIGNSLHGADADTKLDAAAQRLLREPCMKQWQIPEAGKEEGVGLFQAIPNLPSSPIEAARALLRHLDESPTRGDLTQMWGEALRWQAVWLHLAGREDAVQDALALSYLTVTHLPSQNPLLQAMMARGIRAARK